MVFRKMLDVPIEELQEFYDAQMLQKEQDKYAMVKERADFEASGMTDQKWHIKQWNDLVDRLNKDLANMAFDYINRHKPKYQ